MSSLVINNTGQISLSGITAKSGSPMDIQTAVNAVVAAGGGTVYIPAGTFTFNPPVNSTTGGVTIPYTTVPINIIGAGVGVTTLQETVNSGGSMTTYFTNMFRRSWNGQNYAAGSVRISGISFVGFVLNETATSNGAIQLYCTQDFRIDHCSFQDFDSQAISLSGNNGDNYPLITRGVIDHNTFDNPYKAGIPNINNRLWGYGIALGGIGHQLADSWDPNIQDYLGQYYNTSTYNGFPVPSPVYIENNNFTRCRHAISANVGGYYVSRYNYFQEAAPYGQNDAHGGSSSYFGARGMESYGNVFNFTDESYSGGQDAAIEPRGGGGVCWNNTVILNPSYRTPTVQFSNDGEPAPYDVEQFYIWNNTAQWMNGTTLDFNSKISNPTGYVLNVNYFLRAPNESLDGFTYTPFMYPHPLTS